jgi:hypothetical protein
MNNPFLRDFIKMRQGLAENAKAKDKKGIKPLNSLPDVEKTVSLKYLIEEKPSEKVVKEYFKKRIEELETEEDD